MIKKAAKGPRVLFSDFRNLFAGVVLPTVPADECAQNGGACLRQQRGAGRLPAALFHTRSPHLLMCPGSGWSGLSHDSEVKDKSLQLNPSVGDGGR